MSVPGEPTEKNVQDVLSLLESPQKEVYEEVRSLVKEMFEQVRDSWLVTGLLDYFFCTNSRRMLDIILSAPDPHDRHLLDRIKEGIRGHDRFRYMSLLLFGVCQKTPPLWLQKLPRHGLLRELVHTLDQDGDVAVLVTGVLVLVVLLPNFPHDMSNQLQSILDVFWRLLHWRSRQECEKVLEPYLQVCVYALFHWLYSLYPCSLIGFMRINTVGSTNKAFFLRTLRPMLERVRLHPLLLSETKDTEKNTNRWMGLEMYQLVHECAKLSLDPLQATCVENQWSFSASGSDIKLDTLPEVTSSVLSSTENFWLPGCMQSPTPNKNIPRTPVYLKTTPDVTPFTSPMKMDCASETRYSPLSPFKREPVPFPFLDIKKKDLFSKVSESKVLKDKLQQIQLQQIHREHLQAQKEKGSVQEASESEDRTEHPVETETSENEAVEAVERESSASGPLVNEESVHKESESTVLPGRSRKVSVYEQVVDVAMLTGSRETPAASDELGFSEAVDRKMVAIQIDGCNSVLEKRTSEEKETGDENGRRISGDSDRDDPQKNEGIGAPTHTSFIDFVRSVKTNRLRFLSQCGPPPTLGISPTKTSVSPTRIHLKRSHSCSHLPEQVVLEALEKKTGSVTPSLTLSPTRHTVATMEVGCQTEEVPVHSPYDDLLEGVLSLVRPAATQPPEDASNMFSELSPFQLLDQHVRIQASQDSTISNEFGWNVAAATTEKALKAQLQSLHSLLMLERHRRQVHAEGNRRLLKRSKQVHMLEEEKKNLEWEVQQLGSELSDLKKILHDVQSKKSSSSTRMTAADIRLAEVQEDLAKCCEEIRILKDEHLIEMEKNARLSAELEEKKADLFKQQIQHDMNTGLASENEALHFQVEALQKQVTLMGELQIHLQEKLDNLQPSADKQASSQMEHSSYLNEIQTLREEVRNSLACRSALEFRVEQLEDALAEREKQLEVREKKALSAISAREEHCRSVEKRCEILGSTNIALESQMLEMQHKIDVLTRQLRRSQRGRFISTDSNQESDSMKSSPTGTTPPLDNVASSLESNIASLRQINSSDLSFTRRHQADKFLPLDPHKEIKRHEFDS